MPTLPWKPSRVVESLLLAVAVFLTLVPFMEASVFTVFQARDLSRAAAAADGNLFLWGPETTGGGNLPGGFYYWLISIPYLFGLGWTGVWHLMAALDALTVVLIWNFLRHFGVTAASFGVLFYVSAPVRINMFKLFWNPSFLPMFAVVALIGIAFAFSERRHANWAWPLAGVFIGLAMQIHFSAAPLLLAAVVLQIMAPHLGLQRLSGRQWFLGVAALLITLLPYAVWRVAQHQGVALGESPPPTAGMLADSFMAVIKNPAGRYVLDADWNVKLMRFILVTFQMVPWPAWIAILLSVAFYSKEWKPERPKGMQRVFLVCLACSLTSAFLFYYLPFGSRYALVFSLIACLFLGTYSENWFSPRSYFPLGVVVPGLTLVVAAYFATRMGVPQKNLLEYGLAFVCMVAMVWLVRRELPPTAGFKVHPALAALLAVPFAMFYGAPGRQVLGKVPSVSEARAAAKYIRARTGWSYDQFRRKTHLHMFHREADMEEIYNSVAREVDFVPVYAVPDGFLVALTGEEIETPESAAKVIAELQGATEIRQLMKNGEMEIFDFIEKKRLLVASFRWTGQNPSFETFHNIGYSHGPSPEDLRLQTLLETSKESARRIADDLFVFQWNECASQPDYGRAAITVEKQGKKLKATVMGQTLSKPSPWTIPYCTQGWVKPFVQLECENGTHVLNLAKNVGLNWLEPPVAADTFIAPLVRLFDLPCERISRISAGREGTLTNNNGHFHVSRPKTLALDLVRKD